MSNIDIQAADLLETAADRLESGEYHWIKGRTYGINKNDVCAVGALALAAGLPHGAVVRENLPLLRASSVLVTKMRPQIEATLAERDRPMKGPMKDDVFGVTVWNDYVAEDVSDVVEGMKLTAKDLRNQS